MGFVKGADQTGLTLVHTSAHNARVATPFEVDHPVSLGLIAFYFITTALLGRSLTPLPNRWINALLAFSKSFSKSTLVMAL